MIRRLVEAHYFQNNAKPNSAQIRFWLQELRTPQLLVEVAQRHTLLCRRLVSTRPLLRHAALGKLEELARALLAEESAERERDRRYWLPLRAELDAFLDAVRTRGQPKTNGAAGRSALELATRVMACIQEHAARVQPTGNHPAVDLPALRFPRKDKQ